MNILCILGIHIKGRPLKNDTFGIIKYCKNCGKILKMK